MLICWHNFFPPPVARALFCLLVALLSTSQGVADDWPQFLGPHRNGVSDELALTNQWPAAGPPAAWQKSIGHGFAGPVVSDGKLVLFSREADQETITCFDAV